MMPTSFEQSLIDMFEISDMHGLADVIQVRGLTGRAKSAFIAYLHGCELHFVPIGESEWRLEIKSNPKGFIPPELGHRTQSQTKIPKAYSSALCTTIDNPGSLDNRIEIERLKTILASQIATKTIQSEKAEVQAISYRDFEDFRLSVVQDAFKMLASTFKVLQPKHASAIILLITQIPYRPDLPTFKPQSKPYFIKKLQRLKNLIQARLDQQPTAEDRDMMMIVNSLLSDEQRIILFDPIGPSTREAFMQVTQYMSAFPSTELSFVAHESDQQKLMTHLTPTFIQSEAIFQTLSSYPSKMASLQKEAAQLQKFSAGFTAAQTQTPADIKAFLEQIKTFITQKESAINSTQANLDTINSTLFTLKNKIADVEKREDLIPLHTLSFDEKEVVGAIKEAVTVQDHFWLIPTGSHQRPEHELVYEHTQAWSGQPYRGIEHQLMQFSCPTLGGPKGTYSEEINLEKGTYKITCKGPQNCYLRYRIVLQCRHNEHPEQRVQLELWRNEHRKLEAEETELKAQLSRLKTDHGSIQTAYSQTLLLLTKHWIDQASQAVPDLKISASETAKTDLVKNRHAQAALEKKYQPVLAHFRAHRALYDALTKAIEIFDLHSSHRETFSTQYQSVQHLFCDPQLGEFERQCSQRSSEQLCRDIFGPSLALRPQNSSCTSPAAPKSFTDLFCTWLSRGGMQAVFNAGTPGVSLCPAKI